MSRQSNYINPLFQYGEEEIYEEALQQEDDELINQIFSSFQNQPEYDGSENIDYDQNDMIYSEDFDQYINQPLTLNEDFFLNNSYQQEFNEDINWAENDLGFTTGFLSNLGWGEMEGENEEYEYVDEEYNEYYTDEEL